jgi:CheY-like chemotaxis protein
MTTNAKKILLCFSSFPGKELLKEVFAQLNPKIRLDVVSSELDILQYLSRNGARGLPDLIIFDSPPLQPNIGGLVDNLRREPAYTGIPVIFLLPPGDAQTLRKWIQSGPAHFFPPPSKPSECKLYVRQMLDLCKDASTANDVLCIS